MSIAADNRRPCAPTLPGALALLVSLMLAASSAHAQAEPWGGYRVIERGPTDAAWAVVLLHGDGSPPDDMVPFADDLLAHGVSARFVIPDGSLSGREEAWFHDDATLRAACHALDGVLSTLASGGIAADHVIVGGFSKGATLAYVFGAIHRGPLGGLVVASGFPLPLPARVLRGLRGRATFHSHGRSDAQITPALGAELRDQLSSAGAELTELEFDGAHEISSEVSWGIDSFLRARMGLLPRPPERVH